MGQLHAPEGANKKKIIVGRGNGAKKGRTAGRGHDGQNSRSGGGVRPGFEGGQMPLYRRIARRGFSNHPFKKESVAVSLDIISSNYSDGETVDLASLKEKRIVKGHDVTVKILANGIIDKKVKVSGIGISESAAAMIQAAGGEIL